MIVATGSDARALPGAAFDEKLILSNDGALAVGAVPKKLGVIGAGVIGLEMGSVWRRLGAEVTVLEALPVFLGAVDQQIAKEAHKLFTKQGLAISLGVKIGAVTAGKKDVTVEYTDDKGNPQKAVFDKLIVSIGRVPNTVGLNGEAVGLKLDERGFIAVDRQQRTSVPGIYAIGDVCGQPMLAHKASREAEVAAEVIAGHKAEMDAVAIPAVIFTDPEIATVGLMQPDAEKAGRKVKVAKFPFGALGRALAIAETDGFVKVIADATTDEVLGLAVVGPEASDLISEGALALEMGAFLPDLALTVHPHPTLGEAIMEAAKAALGESPHVVGGGRR